MVTIVKNFFYEALYKENRKYVISFIILYLLFAEAIVCIFITATDGWKEMFSSKDEICQKVETDITNIVGDSKDILSLNLIEFEKRLLNIDFEYNTSSDVKVINLRYPKENVGVKIKQTNNGMEISVFRDTEIWIEILMILVFIPLLISCLLLLITIFIAEAFK